mgnify:CR=1 FL=1
MMLFKIIGKEHADREKAVTIGHIRADDADTAMKEAKKIFAIGNYRMLIAKMVEEVR